MLENKSLTFGQLGEIRARAMLSEDKLPDLRMAKNDRLALLAHLGEIESDVEKILEERDRYLELSRRSGLQRDTARNALKGVRIKIEEWKERLIASDPCKASLIVDTRIDTYESILSLLKYPPSAPELKVWLFVDDDGYLREVPPFSSSAIARDYPNAIQAKLDDDRPACSTSTPEQSTDAQAMREAITKALSAWDDSAYVGGPSEREAYRAMFDALSPYRIHNVAEGQLAPASTPTPTEDR